MFQHFCDLIPAVTAVEDGQQGVGGHVLGQVQAAEQHVNLEEAKLPVKNFYTSSLAMFSSGSYWDVATALSFYSPEVAPTRNLLLLDRSVNEKEPALWRVLSVWATCAGLWGLGNRGQKRRGGGSFSLSIYFSFGVFVFLNPKRVSAEPTRVATVSTAQSAGSQLRLGTNS